TAGTLRFADGESRKTFTVPIVNDVWFEDAETVVLRLCRPTGGAILGGVVTATLTINDNDSPGPVIFEQPRSRALLVGSSVTFRVNVSGHAPLHYQWRKSGANIAGANAAEFTIAAAQLSDAANYSVVVTNDFGETVSQSAVLAVYPLPTI